MPHTLVQQSPEWMHRILTDVPASLFKMCLGLTRIFTLRCVTHVKYVNFLNVKLLKRWDKTQQTWCRKDKSLQQGRFIMKRQNTHDAIGTKRITCKHLTLNVDTQTGQTLWHVAGCPILQVME